MAYCDLVYTLPKNSPALGLFLFVGTVIKSRDIHIYLIGVQLYHKNIAGYGTISIVKE